MLHRKCSCHGSTRLAGQCEACQQRLSLDRSTGNAKIENSEAGGVPPIVHEALRSPSVPLDQATRGFFEPRFGHEFADVRMQADAPQAMPKDLTISQPGDQSEREADHVAETVLHTPAQRLADRNVSDQQSGHDFSLVRIHTDARAAEAARAVNARAYTVGNDIVFGEGQYAAHTLEGRRLIAHELTHVMQQASGKQIANRLQRAPVFSDESCDEKDQEKITADVEIALGLVKQALIVLSDPDSVADPLNRVFSIDLSKPGHLEVLVDIVKENLSKIQAMMEGSVKTRCASGREMGGARGSTEEDPETKKVKVESGITYKRSMFSILGPPRARIVDTVIHEHAHLLDLKHAGKTGLEVRGLGLRALDNPESYVRFIRLVT